MKPYKSKRNIPLSDWKEAIHNVTTLKNSYDTLLGFLYDIQGSTSQDINHFDFQISFIPDCEIFKIHFPSSPMTPGSCLLDISKELLEKYLNKTVSLLEVKNIQIHTPISPIHYPTVSFCFEKEEQKELQENNEAQTTQQTKPISDQVSLSQYNVTIESHIINHRDVVLANMGLVIID